MKGGVRGSGSSLANHPKIAFQLSSLRKGSLFSPAINSAGETWENK